MIKLQISLSNILEQQKKKGKKKRKEATFILKKEQGIRTEWAWEVRVSRGGCGMLGWEDILPSQLADG